MNFNFVRGSDYETKQEDKPTIIIIDGLNSCIIIVDRVTQYTLILLTTFKAPPVNIAQHIFNKPKMPIKTGQ